MAKYIGPKTDPANVATQADLASAGGGFEASDTAPSTPSAGDAWFDTTTGEIYIYYDGFWVSPAVIASVPTAAASTITGSNAEGTSTSFARSDHDHALGTDVVGSAQIAADAVGSSEIAAGAVGTSELATAVGNFGAWTDYTPTLKQSGTVLHTKNFASYAQIGKIVIVNFRLTVGNPPGSTANNVISVSVPVAAKTKSLARCGSGSVFDDSTTTTYAGVWIQAFSDDTVVNLIGDWSAAGAWGTVPNLALASGDSVQGFLIYEAA